ncbi:hypothetical protein BHU62_21865 [Serratia marcescens]|uniref:HTH luxR-type domain-containing protein n=1 Tax=Serratia marcescens TaxID=615 RepID=A0A1Q4NUN1_SERMA|nr:LuxR C-terminal-related transcriptional regulator [Serratia marcescens]OKB64579.1 hypothetical protein BHU62_21865 [Serratia marcescens]
MSVTILLIDKNRYFSEGLRLGVSQYFNRKKINVTFTGTIAHKNTSDIIFIEKALGVKLGYLQSCSSMVKQSIFLIEEYNYNKTHYNKIVKKGVEFINRKQSIENVVDALESSLSRKESIYSTNNTNIKKGSHRTLLTPREYEIMRYLRLGMNNQAIGLHLNVSEKTVSAHKRAAMRKLNITQNTELNYWLLGGGLSRTNIYHF